MAFEWVAGLFQSEEARGLSGESSSSVALDDANPYYNYRLRRHSTDGDLASDPGVLWYTSPYVAQRQGLGSHVASEPGDGVANYTDVLLILSEEDFRRTTKVTGEAWQGHVQRVLQQEFENHCRRENLQRPHAHRPLGFRILCDGSAEMHGLSLGLSRGEFITGLLPNLYTGPVFGSYPVIGVHLNLPGVWEGYKEVGRLHNDQILFTLGNHWLDNYSHPGLAEAALYRLQQYPDGNFVHIINPDLQDRYQVTSTVQNNASVLTLATREGRPLAYLVLAVMEPPSSSAPAPERAGQPKISMPTPAPASPQKNQRPGSDFDEPIPSVAPPMLIDDALQPVLSSAPSLGGKTIIPDAPSERIFTLQERGALLQKVHFSAFMLGYDVYVGPRGELGTKVASPAAVFQVRKRSTSIVAHAEGVTLDGTPAVLGEQVSLDRDCEIVIGDTRLEYRDLRHHQELPGWPYVAEIRRPASSTYLIWGEEYQVGRSRECRVVLPDQTSNDNIHWKPKVGDGAYIRARTGDIPKANFYTDSIMVSSEHATIDLSRAEPTVECKASHCYVFVRRAAEVFTLYPTSKGDHVTDIAVEPGDEVLIGNCLFQVGFSPGGEGINPGPAPEIQFSADSLAAAVPEPNFVDSSDDLGEETEVPPTAPVAPPAPEDVPEPASTPPAAEEPEDEEDSEEAAAEEDPDEAATAMWSIEERRADPEDLPAAAGLGEDGALPRPVRPVKLGADSILGEFDDDFPEMADQPSVVEPDGYDQELPVPKPPAKSEATFNSELGDPEDDGAEELPTVDESQDASGWDEDDFSVDATQPPPDPGDFGEESADPPSEVPMPFPDVQEGSAAPEEATELAPADEAPTAKPAADRPGDESTVVYTDDAEAQFELGRPCHVILAGWMLNGEAVVGNHTGADLVLPENRILESQTFQVRDYLRIKVRGRKGSMEVLSPTEVLIDEADPAQEAYDSVEGHTIDVIRRDEEGEEDFAIRLGVVADKKLPDPRARLVSLDYEDPLAAALVTRGLPLNQARTVEFAPLTLTLTWTGEHVVVSDYSETYRDPEGGFHPFFVQSGGKRFTTAPEDGSTFELAPGDRFVIGQAVYVVREE